MIPTADQKVAIASDSTLDIPDAELEALGIALASVHVLADGKSFKDREEISIDEANRLMLEGKVRLTTSAAGPADWLAAYEKCLDRAQEIVAFSISPLLSSTHAGATSAVDLLDEGEVTVMDVKTILASMGLVVRAAARLAKAGASRDEVVAVSERLIGRVRMVVTSHSRAFAKQGGRYEGEGVPEDESGFPIYRIWAKGWKEIDRAPDRQGAIDRVFAWMERDLAELGYEKGRPLSAIVDHIVCPDEALAMKDRVRALYDPEELDVWEIGPTAGIHLGPGTIGIAYLYDDPREG